MFVDKLKIALVYDRVNKWGGAERILLALHRIFPFAPLYTSVYDIRSGSYAKVFPKVVPSFLQRLPIARRNHEFFAYLMPFAFESFDFSDFDVVISVTSEAAKGIITKPNTLHICYCLTPTRYLWNDYDLYFKSPIFRLITYPIVSHLKRWDKVASQRPDIFLSVSKTVKKRIKKYYQKNSVVLYPPLDDKFCNIEFTRKKGDFFLVVSRLVSYKKVDLAIEAFNKLGWNLIVIGEGRQRSRLERVASRNIKFLPGLTDDQIISYYKRARALIMPQEEDFGLVSLEAQACGCPVIAYKAGGAEETIIEGKTGEFFYPQTSQALIDVLGNFGLKHDRYRKEFFEKNIARFTFEKFRSRLLRLIEKHVNR